MPRSNQQDRTKFWLFSQLRLLSLVRFTIFSLSFLCKYAIKMCVGKCETPSHFDRHSLSRGTVSIEQHTFNPKDRHTRRMDRHSARLAGKNIYIYVFDGASRHISMASARARNRSLVEYNFLLILNSSSGRPFVCLRTGEWQRVHDAAYIQLYTAQLVHLFFFSPFL